MYTVLYFCGSLEMIVGKNVKLLWLKFYFWVEDSKKYFKIDRKFFYIFRIKNNCRKRQLHFTNSYIYILFILRLLSSYLSSELKKWIHGMNFMFQHAHFHKPFSIFLLFFKYNTFRSIKLTSKINSWYMCKTFHSFQF